MNEFQCRLVSHGRRHLELGVVYPLSRARKRTDYQVDAFFFTPYHLGLTRRRYGVERFLSDLSSYIRFSPASLSFAKMTDPSCRLSPLNRISNMLDGTEMHADLDLERLIYEIRAFVNAFNGQLRETRHLVSDLLREKAATDEVLSRFLSILDDIDACLGSFRDLRARFISPVIPERLRLATAWADESVSLKTEAELYRIHALFEHHPELAAGGETIKPFLMREQAYRQRQNYQTVIQPDDPETGERFLYRESMLKKWAQTALYMEFFPDKTISRVVQILAGVAAAAAMAFAIAATFLAQQFFSMYSLPWVILVVVAYIFKDRIKETTRDVLLALVPKIVADESKSLIDQRLKRKVGGMRSRVQFGSTRQIPPQVERLRNSSGNPFNSIMPPENIIQYHSILRLNGQDLLDNHPRLEAIVNILRLRLDAWFVGMDDPFSVVRFIKDERIQKMKARRVYHVHVIVRLVEAKDESKARLFKYLLVLNRDGLIRIEKQNRNQDEP